MPEENCSTWTEFILLGFTSHAEVEISLFGLFLLIYATTFVGNTGLVQFNACLHTPMYYFLSNSSFLEIAVICHCSQDAGESVSTVEDISLIGCAMQMFLFAAFADAEYLMLAAMAYDRYMAICHPLLYTVSCRVCTSMVAGAYLSGALTSLVNTSFTFTSSFCGSNVINHFFCDIPPLLELSCSNTHISEVPLVTLCGFIQTSTFLTIVVSYACIPSTILWIHVADSRHKSFYTCTSHLMTVGLFYGSLHIFTTQLQLLAGRKAISAFYTVVFPMLNPLIYSLRNKLVKDALRRTAERTVFPQ